MKNNVHAATLIIAVLSLLLGLSIGQNHRQYLRIQQLQSWAEPDYSETLDSDFEPMEFRMEWHGKCSELNALQQELEARRAELRAAREHLRAERENQLRELHRQIDRMREMQQHMLAR